MAYARYTRINHSRQYCNLYVILHTVNNFVVNQCRTALCPSAGIVSKRLKRSTSFLAYTGFPQPILRCILENSNSDISKSKIYGYYPVTFSENSGLKQILSRPIDRRRRCQQLIDDGRQFITDRRPLLCRAYRPTGCTARLT